MPCKQEAPLKPILVPELFKHSIRLIVKSNITQYVFTLYHVKVQTKSNLALDEMKIKWKLNKKAQFKKTQKDLWQIKSPCPKFNQHGRSLTIEYSRFQNYHIYLRISYCMWVVCLQITLTRWRCKFFFIMNEKFE